MRKGGQVIQVLSFVERVRGCDPVRGDSRSSMLWGVCSRVTRVDDGATTASPSSRGDKCLICVVSVHERWSGVVSVVGFHEVENTLYVRSSKQAAVLLSFPCNSRLSICRSLNDCIAMMASPTTKDGGGGRGDRTGSPVSRHLIGGQSAAL